VSRLLLAPFVLTLGCAQLVVFDQAIVGQPDVVEEHPDRGGQLCDPEAQMGESALCTESCQIDVARAETSCGDRVTLDGGRARVRVAGLHEVELTVRACAREGRLLRVVGENGASFAIEGRSLRVEAAEEAGARPFVDEDFLPVEEGCEDRTLIVQTGRMSLEDSGRRLCSAHLVPVEGAWSVDLSRSGLASVELCFRAPRRASE